MIRFMVLAPWVTIGLGSKEWKSIQPIPGCDLQKEDILGEKMLKGILADRYQVEKPEAAA